MRKALLNETDEVFDDEKKRVEIRTILVNAKAKPTIRGDEKREERKSFKKTPTAPAGIALRRIFPT
jgi:hypothetical protein